MGPDSARQGRAGLVRPGCFLESAVLIGALHAKQIGTAAPLPASNTPRKITNKNRGTSYTAAAEPPRQSDLPAFPAILPVVRDQNPRQASMPVTRILELTFFLISSFHPSSRVMIFGVDAFAMVNACASGLDLVSGCLPIRNRKVGKTNGKWENELDARGRVSQNGETPKASIGA